MDKVDGRALRGIRRRREILKAADEFFRVNGYAGASLRDFSTSIGMSHSGVLRHFPSKSELLQAVLDEMPSSTITKTQGSPTHQLLAAARDRHEDSHRLELYFALLGEAAAPGHPAHDSLATQVATQTGWITDRFPGDGAVLGAAWDGLEILARYLGNAIDPVSVMDEILPARSGNGGLLAQVVASAAAREIPSPPARPTTSRDQILVAAALAFAEEGYRAVSIRSIAARLGIAHGTILYHFRDKRELLEEVLSNRNGDFDLGGLEPTTGTESLAHLYALIATNESRAGIIRVYSSLLCEATSTAHPAHEFFQTRYERVFTRVRAEYLRLVDEGSARHEVSAHAVTAWFIACWDGLQIHRNFAPTIDLPTALFSELERLL